MYYVQYHYYLTDPWHDEFATDNRIHAEEYIKNKLLREKEYGACKWQYRIYAK